jgi:hypothetical protein
MRPYKGTLGPAMSVIEQVCKQCGELKSASHFSVDRTVKAGLRSKCKKCSNKNSAQRYQETREKHLAKNREYYKENKARKAATNRIWYELTKDQRRLNRREYYAKNPDKVKETNRNWRTENPHLIPAYGAKRRAATIQRTPRWLTPDDHAFISGLYDSCLIITALTGIKHHVDHVLPLQGKYISGLHVPGNLQILTAVENSQKLNVWVPT